MLCMWLNNVTKIWIKSPGGEVFAIIIHTIYYCSWNLHDFVFHTQSIKSIYTSFNYILFPHLPSENRHNYLQFHNETVKSLFRYSERFQELWVLFLLQNGRNTIDPPLYEDTNRILSVTYVVLDVSFMKNPLLSLTFWNKARVSFM